MKVLILFTGLLLPSLIGAQIKALTEMGDAVILYEDGTWKYLQPKEVVTKEIPVNPESFERDTKADFLVKSKVLPVGFYINPKSWKFSPGEDSDAEYEFEHKDKDLYGMAITERVEIPLETLMEIALENAQSVSPDMELVKQEYRSVNDQQVLHLQMNGTIQGIKFSYYGYYFSNENGSVQFLAYTSQNLMKLESEEVEELLNGFVVTE